MTVIECMKTLSSNFCVIFIEIWKFRNVSLVFNYFCLMLCCQKLGEKTTITKYCRTCALKFMKKWMKRYKYHILNIKQVNLMILISIRRQALKEFRLKKNFSWPFLFVFFLSLWHAAFVMYCQRHHTGRESVLPGPPPPTGVS